MSKDYFVYGIAEGVRVKITLPDDVTPEAVATVLNSLQAFADTFDSKKEFEESLTDILAEQGINWKREH